MKPKLLLTYDAIDTRLLVVTTSPGIGRHVPSVEFRLTPLIDQFVGYCLKQDCDSWPSQIHFLLLIRQILENVEINAYDHQWRFITSLLKPQQKLHANEPPLVIHRHWFDTRHVVYHFKHEKISFQLQKHIPFVLVVFPYDLDYVAISEISKCRITNFAGTIIHNLHPNIVSTNNPKLFLIIFSSVLQDEDDCAKLIRTYAKNKSHPLWEYDNSIWIMVEMTFHSLDPESVTSFGIQKNFTGYYYYKTKQELIQSIVNGDVEFDIAARTYFNTNSLQDLL